ncbi:guanylate kinase [Hyphococcus flavus]|uniref:Guanylate kinase n=1 Tax=Hyphococcus flavus TaxID=1866326 RepID=A0AAE9ZAJ1_9PROT|nr:guanylate kinase [Hyphococcus flavus]WDI30744.1 guanylate kinase [Hyphococcus flavus]
MLGGDLSVARRGLMFILSSPSGAGKTTLADRLLASDNNLTLSISATTRQRRPGEAHGKDYYFVSEEEFTRMRENAEFLESANVFGHHYGTPRSLVEDTLRQGKDVLFDIDWQGAQQLDEVAGEDVVKVFILPPSREELEARLRKRAQDPEDVVQKRMAKADSEMSHWAEYDYVIINYDLDESEELLRSILFAERLKRRRQIGLAAIVKDMIGDG